MDQAITNHPEPNPGFGEASILDKLRVVVFVFCVPLVALEVAVRRNLLRQKNGIGFKGDFVRTLVRFAPSIIPASVVRAAGTRKIPAILSSPRFSSHQNELFQRILRKDFAGFWICKGAPGHHQEPSKCDIVLYYIHGGGFRSGHPGAILPTLLRMAEIAQERGISIAIFALNYSLAPEATAPKQLSQAIAAYRYILEEVKIDPSRIAVQGDSAGAHLVLWMLANLRLSEFPCPEAGVVLIAPWIDLWCSRDGSYVRNKYLDYLERKSLVRGASSLFPAKNAGRKEPCTDFLEPLPDGLSWSTVITAKTWVGVGDQDLFHDDVVAFCGILEKSGVDVKLSVAPKKYHTWELVEDTLSTDKYINTTASVMPKGVMLGASRLADALFHVTRALDLNSRRGLASVT